jgi:hypothetical protein
VLGNLFTSNTDLKIYEGAGGSYFSVTSSPRIFNGKLLYNAEGCSSARLPVTFSVVSGVTVTALGSHTAVCSGNNVTLTANGATNYTWSPAIGIAPDPFNAVVLASPTVFTSYTVVGTVPGCTAVGTATYNLTVLQGPTLTISPSQTVIAGSILTLTTGGAFTCSWSPGGSNNTTILISPLVTTVYTVTGTNSFGCKSSITTTVYVGNVGLKEYGTDAGLLLFPNPANDELNIEFSQGVKTNEKINIEILDVFGKKILMTDLSKTKIDVRLLPEGIYFITVKYKAQTFMNKFVIAR